jgi:hypothetical protein
MENYLEMPFITRVGHLLLDAKCDSTLFINATGCDYTVEDLMNVVGPLLDGEKCTYSIKYNNKKTKGFLSIY